MRLPARHSIRHRHAAPLSCADERPPDVFVLAGDVASSLLYGAVESATDGWLVVAEGRDAATDPDVVREAWNAIEALPVEQRRAIAGILARTMMPRRHGISVAP